MVKLRRIFVFAILSLSVGFYSNAQELKVVSTGQGTTEDEATKTALRSALEDAYGTFISSSTKIENDVLVSDEIVSLTQGNIKEYDVVNSSRLANGLYGVTVESVISLNELATYCQSKGMSVSFNGKAFGMDLKLREFNRKNEIKVLKNLCQQLLAMNPCICDYELKSLEPKTFDLKDNTPDLELFKALNKYELRKWIEQSHANIFIKILVLPKTNGNYSLMKDLIESTFKSISLTKAEIKTYKKIGINIFKNKLYDNDDKEYYFRNREAVELAKKFYFTLRETCTKNWVFYDGVKGSVWGILISIDGFDNYLERKANFKKLYNMGIDVVNNSDDLLLMYGFNHFRNEYYPNSTAEKLILFYSFDDINRVQEFKVEPFNEEAYETIIKPRLLSIIAEFDNIE